MIASSQEMQTRGMSQCRGMKSDVVGILLAVLLQML